MSIEAMIEVENLTKHYTRRTGVTDLSFKVGRGEIVGLLGPNGAGKSTTMRILSCYMPADTGIAKVAGFDVFHQSDEVRRRIGYMPENNPLYSDMRVRDYLKFRGRLKGLSGGRLKERLDIVLQQCGLAEVARRIIAHLSKGFRQRVGLADALIHEPDLVILDEPTIGLDPNQIRSVRQLIKDLGKQTTILLSTHILPEVEMTCSRVLIMHEGRILAADSPRNLQKQMLGGNAVIVEIAASAAELSKAWEELDLIEDFDVAPSEGEYHRSILTPHDGQDIRPEIFNLARQRGWVVRELTRNHYSLEDVFVRMTRPNREEED